MRIRFRPAAVLVLVLVAAFSLGHVPASLAATAPAEYVCDFEGSPAIPSGWAVSASPQASYQVLSDPDGTMLRQDILPTSTSNQGSVLSFSPPADGVRYELEGWFYVEQAYQWGMATSPFVMVFPGGKAAGAQISTNVGTKRGYYGFYTGSGTISVWDRYVTQRAWHDIKVTYDRATDKETVVLDGVTILANQAMDTGGAAPSRIDFYVAGGWSPGNAITQYLDDCVVRVWRGAGGPPALSVSQPSVIAPEGSVARLGGLVSDPDGDPVSLHASRGGVVNNGDGTWTWSQAVSDGPACGGPVTITASDGKGGTAEVTFQLVVANVAPAVTLAPGAPGLVEGGAFATTGSFADPGPDLWTATVDYGDGSGVQPLAIGAGKTFALAHTYADEGEYVVKVAVRDKDAAVGTGECAVSVANAAPVVGAVTGPVAPVAPGTAVDVSAPFTDAGISDVHSAVWDWGDGTTSAGSVAEADGSGSVGGSHVYAAPGVYAVKVVVTDGDGGSGSADFSSVTVVAPAGKITGGGSFQPVTAENVRKRGALARVTFGLNARYERGAAKPSGNAEFQLHGARKRFKATGFDYLLVDGGKAVLTGTGTIDGKGAYRFLLSVRDGRPDVLRLKVWDAARGAVAFDSQPGAEDGADPTTPIRGSIVVHKK